MSSWSTIAEWADLLNSAARQKGAAVAIPQFRAEAKNALGKVLMEEVPGLNGLHNLAPSSPFQYFVKVGGGAPIKVPTKSPDVAKYASAVDANGAPVYRSLNKTQQEIDSLLPHKDIEDAAVTAQQAAQVAQTPASPTRMPWDKPQTTQSVPSAGSPIPKNPPNQPWGEPPPPPRQSVPSAGTSLSAQRAGDIGSEAVQKALDESAAINAMGQAGLPTAAIGTALELSQRRPTASAPSMQQEQQPQSSAFSRQPDILSSVATPGADGSSGRVPDIAARSYSYGLDPRLMPASESIQPQPTATQPQAAATRPSANRSLPDPYANRPDAPPRPADLGQSSGNIIERAVNAVRNIGKGPDYLSSGKHVTDNGQVNWISNPDEMSAADFAKLSQAQSQLNQQPQPSAEKRGGRVNKTNEHSAILHKALEIIHHMAMKH